MNSLDNILNNVVPLVQIELNNVPVSVLRLDLVHPIISGNKYFKLQYYLEAAAAQKAGTVATFGGAYSNHIVATACACRQAGLGSIGYIRGQEPARWSHTLQQAHAFGMQLRFTDRDAYRNKAAICEQHPGYYWIAEGGYGDLGAKGAATIAGVCPGFEEYTHIACAMGTGTMMAGLIKAALPHQEVIGFPVLKGYDNIGDVMKQLLTAQEQQKKYTIWPGHHFGGYAKATDELIAFMNSIWTEYELPLDFVYTAKALHGLQQLAGSGYVNHAAKLLFIHSGGLQGNQSLKSRLKAGFLL
jgi:1-aminocyclopropane-1-carboxylate deaminase